MMIMSHPDWEFCLKPLGAMPDNKGKARYQKSKDGESSAGDDCSSWILELIEGLMTTMVGSQQGEAYSWGRDSTIAEKEKTKSYQTFPLRQIKRSEYDTNMPLNEVQEKFYEPGHLALNQKQPLSRGLDIE